MRFRIKGDRGERRKRNTPIDCTGGLVWFLGWALKWSGVAHSHRRPSGQQELAHADKDRQTERERRMKGGKEQQAAITKTTTVRFLSDGSPG